MRDFLSAHRVSVAGLLMVLFIVPLAVSGVFGALVGVTLTVFALVYAVYCVRSILRGDTL